MFAPARIPVEAGKNMAKTEKNVSSPRNWGPKFSKNGRLPVAKIRQQGTIDASSTSDAYKHEHEHDVNNFKKIWERFVA